METKAGFYGEFGGAYIPEILKPVFDEISRGFNEIKKDKAFLDDYAYYLKHFVGRPTPLMYAENSTKKLGGAKIFLKLEGLANTGAHKINNALGQALLAKKLGKRKIIAETGAGQHGVAVASICAQLCLECKIFMGSTDVKRQHPNVFWMEQFGAEVHPVEKGTKTLKDAVNEALREWTKSPDDTYYLLGSALGAHPYPEMVKFFQSVISREVKQQLKAYGIERPDTMIACVGGGSNAIGFFSDYLKEATVELIGVEAGGKGIKSGKHAARITGNAYKGII
ncbi:MAG: tryptophan synthase subunit beta, partial [Thermotogota bacterium]